MKKLCVLLLKFYRRYISPLKRKPTCRFYPTCSCYALQAYEKHGFFGGTYLTLRRILRCNPLFSGGVDKVPEKIVFRQRNCDKVSKNGEK